MDRAKEDAPSWRHLNHLQLGKYAEYYSKMEMIRQGWDVYSAEIDDKGIDFVLRTGSSGYHDVQVKSLRWPKSQYTFIPEEKIELRKNYLVLLVLFEEGAMPFLYIIPSLVWKTPNSIFVHHKYAGLKSKPEFGIQIPKKARHELDRYTFKGVIT